MFRFTRILSIFLLVSFSLHAQEILRIRSVAYFGFNTRYTSSDTTNPPHFDRVNKDKFVTYSPLTKVRDVEAIVDFFKVDARFSRSHIFLLGVSEGASISALVAERALVPISAIFLIGTPPENGYESAIWHLNGGSSMDRDAGFEKSLSLCACATSRAEQHRSPSRPMRNSREFRVA